MFFAAVGDVHGHMHAMVALLRDWEEASGETLGFVLQVGDFEPHRHEDDLATMAAPSKYRQLGDFADYHSGRATMPWPVYFIGGNHEPTAFSTSTSTARKSLPTCATWAAPADCRSTA